MDSGERSRVVVASLGGPPALRGRRSVAPATTAYVLREVVAAGHEPPTHLRANSGLTAMRVRVKGLTG